MKKKKVKKLKNLTIEEQVAMLNQVHQALKQIQGLIPSLSMMPIYQQILNSVGLINNSILTEIEKKKPKKKK